MHQRATIKKPENIEAGGILQLGIAPVGFITRMDKTHLNIQGKLRMAGNYNIGRGCRFHIGNNATVNIGVGGYMNVNTKLIIMHGLSIGDGCAISWDCQFLDEDFHAVSYAGKKDRAKEIQVGNHVLIGCGSKIYQGTTIPNGCIIASNSVVRGIFTRESCIIGGNPARVIKENVSWS